MHIRVILLLFPLFFGAQNRLNAGLLVEAHRGNSIAAPENTLASINAAAGFADLTEMDVRQTEDGELVLMHDGNVRRTTDGAGAVRRRSLAELQSLDAGSWFSAEYAGEPVPTLEQAMNAAFAVGIEPLIERKAGSATAFHNEFIDLGLDESQFRVISFNHRFIKDLHALNPDYRLGILGSGAITSAKMNRLMNKGADFISWHHGSIRSQQAVDLVHASGLELHAWTVNDPGRMLELIDLGIDGITTDDPATLHSLLPAAALAYAVPEPSWLSTFLWIPILVLRQRRRRRTSTRS